MKYLAFSFLFLLAGKAIAQDSLIKTEFTSYSIHGFAATDDFMNSKEDFMDYTKGTKLIAVNSYDSNFKRTYLIDKNGETISSGYMPSAYYLPNDNFIVISGKNTMNQDSFNPYGANNMASAILLGTFNNFISRLKKNKR